MLLDEPSDHIFGYCRNVDLDARLGLTDHLTLVPCIRGSYFIDRMLAALNKFFHTGKTKEWRLLYPYKYFLHLISKDDLVLSTGGDMLCYDNNEVVFTNNWLHKRGVKTVLWGCSMGPENQTKEKLATLFRFSFIYTRESLTYNYLKSLGLKNICLLPDPAFILEPQAWDLPEYLQKGNAIGLNISNYVMGGMSIDGSFGQEVTALIDYLLKEADNEVLLVPHVTWNFGDSNQDDREMAHIIRKHFGNDERIHILDIDNLNYCQIRYAISRCKAFVGARTHAVISAYSTCVPTIALGYSIKSRGIAKDLGLDERLVVDSKKCPQGALLSSFTYLMQNAETIREHLCCVMPEYKQRPYQIRDYLAQIKSQHS